ncbi:hypothetical protein CHS0354_020925 [Potamilus streckersoni]|uniref:Uncharacterized protein n=1 Tax=Potamilus streckersoni TaxID=2493646 RepID=A0AAE0SWG2_9BIVA|nr:hypothetical protein CHS0354_020925 [Potamilus streckersoni]
MGKHQNQKWSFETIYRTRPTNTGIENTAAVFQFMPLCSTKTTTVNIRICRHFEKAATGQQHIWPKQRTTRQTSINLFGTKQYISTKISIGYNLPSKTFETENIQCKQMSINIPNRRNNSHAKGLRCIHEISPAYAER